MSYEAEASAQTLDNSFWSILKEALRGSHRDLTEGSIVAAIVILAIPMILEMGMESLFVIVDIFWVAHLGADSVAVVSLTESVLALIYAVAIGLSIGATAAVARRIGEKDTDEAAHTATHVVYLGLIVSAVMGAIGVVAAPYIFRALGAEPHVTDLGLPFMRIMYGTNVVIVFLFLLNAIFRGAGDAAIAMRVLMLSNGLNIVLGPLFIFGVGFFPHLGVTGAAVATALGRGTGALFAAWSLFFRKGGRIEVHARHWKFDPKLLWSLVRLSSTAILQLLISTASWSVLIRVVAGFGTVAIAGYQIGLRVIIFMLLPAVGLANAAATLVGQNLGAGKPDRAERSVWIAGAINAAILGTIGLLFLFFSGSVARIFTDDADVLKYASECLFVVAFGYAFYGLGIVIGTAFNGAGDTITPTYLNLFVFWLFEIPLAYTLAYHFDLGPQGVFLAITIAFSVLAVISALVFRTGRWKTKVV